ncbi:unnamed protein product [Toxocara canis]|uniref:nicotinamidase n=1 Tax=Toxocara canis TaxID=6265 RepID=A0A183UDU2_TOXCA|nr:unnamed protein product [Toxocara canis]
MLLSGRSDYELLQQLLKPSSRYWDQQHVLNPTGRPMRLSILEPGTTRAQFADSIKEISDETVTEQMLDNLFDKFDEVSTSRCRQFKAVLSRDCQPPKIPIPLAAGQETKGQKGSLQDGDGQLSDVECQHVNRLLIVPLNRLRTALIVVDFQNDFVTGSLAIKNGSAGEDPSEALVPLNRLLAECPFTLIVYTMDWHPYNHISFWEHCRNSDRKLCDEDRARKLKPYDVVHFETPKVQQASLMQRSPPASELEELLRSESIDAIFVCGLAYDICVAATTNDAVDLGFLTALIADCSKGLNTYEMRRVDEELSQRNVAILNSESVLRIVSGNLFPWQWICSLAGLTTSPD